MKKISIILILSSFAFSQDSSLIDSSINIIEDSKDIKNFNIEKSYNNFEWGYNYELFDIDTTLKNFSSDSSKISYDDYLGKDSVKFNYYFSKEKFWKVDIYYLSTLNLNDIDSLITKFYQIEKILFQKYGPPLRTSQNEIGSNREYNFSDFPKVNRIYYRSSWSLGNINIELVLDNITESSQTSKIFENFKKPISLYYYNLNYYDINSVPSDSTKFFEETCLIIIRIYIYISFLFFLSCSSPPPMVLSFNIIKDNVTSLHDIQNVLEYLDYEIEFFDKTDKSFITKTKLVKRFMRPITYKLFVSSNDRITIMIDSEVQIFKRSSNISLGNTQNQVIKNSSDDLNLHIQKKIFNPIIKNMNKIGYKYFESEKYLYLNN